MTGTFPLKYSVEIAGGSKKEINKLLYSFTYIYNNKKLSLYQVGVDYEHAQLDRYTWASFLEWGQQFSYDWIIVSKREENSLIGVIKFIAGKEHNYLEFEYVQERDKAIISFINFLRNILDKHGYYTVGGRNLTEFPCLMSIKSRKQEAMLIDENLESQPTSDLRRSPPLNTSRTNIPSLEPFLEDNSLPSQTSKSYSGPLPIKDAQRKNKKYFLMKKDFNDYNLKTTEEIIDKLYDSWIIHKHELGGRWGPGIISNSCNVCATTVGRYLGAFCSVGINEITVDGETIPIPHHSKK